MPSPFFCLGVATPSLLSTVATGWAPAGRWLMSGAEADCWSTAGWRPAVQGGRRVHGWRRKLLGVSIAHRMVSEQQSVSCFRTVCCIDRLPSLLTSEVVILHRILRFWLHVWWEGGLRCFDASLSGFGSSSDGAKAQGQPKTVVYGCSDRASLGRCHLLASTTAMS